MRLSALALPLLLAACGGPGMRLDWEVTWGDYSQVPAMGSSGPLITSVYDAYTSTGYAYGLDAGNGEVDWLAESQGMPAWIAADESGRSIVATGSMLSSYEPDGSGTWDAWFNFDVIYAAPAIDHDGRVVVGRGAPNKIVASTLGDENPDRCWGTEVEEIPRVVSIDSDGTVFVGAAGEAYGLSEDGELLWSQSIAADASGLAVGDDAIYIALWNMGLAALDKDGELLWELVELGYVQEPVIGPRGNLYVAGMNGTWSLDPSDGSVIWENLFECGPITVGADDRLYAMCVGADGMSSYLGWMFTVMDLDGNVLWTEDEYCAIEGPNGGAALRSGKAYFAGGDFNACVWSFSGAPKLARTPWPKERADNGRTGRRYH
jgi:hypothetical protein